MSMITSGTPNYLRYIKTHKLIVGVKTGGSRVGVPNCASKADGNRRQGTRCFTQVRALLMEVKPYVLLDLFLMI